MRNDVYEELKRRIIDLEIRPGDGLQEHVLAEEFGVSRTPIREAFIRLEAEGLIGVAQGRGTFVTEVSFKKLKESFEIRSFLAGLVGRLVPERATKEDLDELQDLVEQIRRESDLAALRLLDRTFHDRVNRATHNVLLAETLERLRNQVTRAWDSHVPEGEDHYFMGIADEFDAFLRAAKRKDGEECTRVLRQHLARFIDEIITFSVPME